MNAYYNTYTYNIFKQLATLNIIETTEFDISDQDLEIIKAIYDDLFINTLIDFEDFMKIIKRLSIEFFKTPIGITMMIHEQLKKE